MSTIETCIWLTVAVVLAGAVTLGIAVPATDVLVGEAWSVFATTAP